MSGERILVVDDEEPMRYFLETTLEGEGYRVLTAASGEEALKRLEEASLDLALVDLKMEGIDGLQVMEEVKRRPFPPVVIILTAYATLDSAIAAMRCGGNDYLIKPCRTEELLASVEKGLAKRRQELQQEELVHLIEESARRLRVAPASGEEGREERHPVPPRFLQARGLLLDRERLLVTLQGQPLHLTPTEFRILTCFMEQPNQLVTYRQLAQALHGYEGEEREARDALNTHLWRLRRKLGTSRDGLPYILNVRGQGYMLVSEEKSEAK